MESHLSWLFTSKVKYIPFEEAKNLSSYRHCAHCCIYALNPSMVMGEYQANASVMMQNRFDGMFGFPGGIINKENDILSGLNRELEEEINLDSSKYQVMETDHLCSHIYEEKKSCFHFFKLVVSQDEFLQIERRAYDAKEYGHEVMGNTRVPLYRMECGVRGFPQFLCNSFAGNARDQLLYVLLKENILSEEDIKIAISVYRQITGQEIT